MLTSQFDCDKAIILKLLVGQTLREEHFSVDCVCGQAETERPRRREEGQ